MSDEVGRGQHVSSLPEALFAEHRRAWRRVVSFPRILAQAFETKVGTTPHDVVLQRHTHRLLRYRRETPAVAAEPVLFCYALINRPYILDLQPEKSVVRRYLERGFDVYMIDWGSPGPGDHGLTLQYYIEGFLAECVDFVRRQHGVPALNLLGYCMGGTLSALYTALNPQTLNTLTLLAAPIDFGRPEALLSLWAHRERFDVDAFVDAHGNCPAWFLQLCFLSMKPVQNWLGKGFAVWDQMDDARSMSSHFAMERWINDNIPVAGETFREFVKKLYQRNELVRGEFELGGRRVDLGRIECPLLLLTAKNDHLVPPASTEGILGHVGSRDVESMTIDAGHVGLVVSGRAQKSIWPEATRWLLERSTARA